VGDRLFATEPDGGVRPYFSRRNADRAVSAIDVLQEKVSGDRLKRSFVLIGATALALGDNVFTPVGEKIPGVELHAQLLENMSDGTFLARPAWAPYVEAGVLLLLGGLVIAAMPRLSLRYALPIALSFALILPLVAYGLFRTHRLLFDAATPAVALVLLVGAMLALGLADATRNRKALQEVLQRQREESARVAGEMQAAQRIQLDTLPRPESVQDSRVELAAAMEPALEVGGDLYDFYRLDGRRLFVLLGDVSGKGLPASIFMAVSKALCKSTVLRGAVSDVGKLVAEANAEVSRDNPAALFVTAFAAILDLETGELRYCNAGQENPWLVKADGAIERLVDGGGPPLCAVDGYEYPAASAALGRGDLICVVSDGITEASDTRGGLYGTGRVEAALANARSAREAVDAIRTSVKAFAGGAVQADDMTVLAVRWFGAAPR
jgi:serine phosphatase RsbU (regulator of sigma subunit)